MKSTLILTALVTAALATGCNPSTKTTMPHTAGSPAPQADQPLAATVPAPNYTFAQKSEFIANMQAQLTDLNRSLDELSARIEKSSDAVKTEAAPKLAGLREQATQLKKQLGEAANATASTWSGIKADSEKNYAAMKDGFAQCRQWASDKMMM